MDNRISIGDRMDLEKIETRISAVPDARPKIYVSQVLDEAEDGNSLVAMPIQEGKVIPLGVGQEFFATFYTKSGLLRCQIAVMERYKKGSLFLMKIEQKTALQKVQRREYYRLECSMPIEYRNLDEMEKKVIESGTEYDADKIALEWKKGVIMDLSGGGIRFISPVAEERDSVMQVRFSIEDGHDVMMIYAYAIVLRSERNQNNNAVYEHRLMFRKMNKTVREKIIRYIFNVQRKNRSKTTGM